MLRGKHILVGISGGIAAYKIPELIRLLKKEGADVCVCTTRNALQFVTPLTLETLSNNQVYSDVFAPHNNHQTEHISLPDWADLMIIAPCTANVIGKMAAGIADDALTTTFLAMLKPVLVAPAMNDKMLAHPAVQRNLNIIAGYENTTVLDCDSGFLACGTTGKGRMQEPEDIVMAADILLEKKTLAGKRVLITAGPTQEKIDPVRYISNYSTGKMGYALAYACLKRGAEVTLVSGPSSERFCGKTINVTSAKQMFEVCKAEFAQADITILCAAVADYSPATEAETKIKRNSGELNLRLQPTHDIAAELGKQKTQNQLLIGFALETDNEEENAIGKMQRKNLDYIVLNSLQDKGAGFGCDTNKVTVFSQKGSKTSMPLASKQEIAASIIDIISQDV
ncbi:MAG: bifunctional phosphopantothenoylcysteine decarboxylase/phosphopantothenate--cysteine ligase CoaBC [Paludibacteraceae bacterium]|nr:bifunctional phosphopantothenoylcysteine decarboxylase/phosphopantothenate--cysteine ligase CoaBC [Paludibacteraceae bacterium]